MILAGFASEDWAAKENKNDCSKRDYNSKLFNLTKKEVFEPH